MTNYKNYLIRKLQDYSKKDIILTTHVKVRIIQRQISKKEVIFNLTNPKRLIYALKQKARHPKEEKFECFFGYTKNLCYKYVLVITAKLIVVTVFKINRRWQKAAEKKLKKDAH